MKLPLPTVLTKSFSYIPLSNTCLIQRPFNNSFYLYQYELPLLYPFSGWQATQQIMRGQVIITQFHIFARCGHET
jgi:hypothetical protein